MVTLILLSFGATLYLFIASGFLAKLLGIKITQDPFTELRKKMGPWRTLFFICLTAPICEEVFFRYVIQQGLLLELPLYLAYQLNDYGMWAFMVQSSITCVRVLLTTALFGLVHLQNKKIFGDAYSRLQWISASFLGIFLGIAAEYFPLLVPMLIHVFYNSLCYAHTRIIFSKEQDVLNNSGEKIDTTLHQTSLPLQ